MKKMTAHQKQVYWRLIKKTLPYWRRLVLAILFGFMFGGSLFGLLASAKGGFNQVFGGEVTRIQEMATNWLGDVYSGGVSHSFILTLLLLGAAILFMVLRGFSFFMSKYLIEWVTQRVIMNLRNELFSKILHLPMLYFTGSRTGELMSRTLNDTQLVERGISEVICDLVQQPFVLIAAAAALFMIDIRFALISIVIFPICILPIVLFGRRIRRHARAGQERIADLSSIQQEAIGGAAIVKAFGMEEREQNRFSKHNAEFFKRQIKIIVSRAAINPMMEIFSVIAACIVLLCAKYFAIDLVDVFIFCIAMVAMYDPAKKLSRVYLVIQQSSAAAERIFEILDTRDTVVSLPGAVDLTGRVREIQFKDISFSYNKEKVVLDHINFTAHAGELIALVGGSGSGKTTLINLLPRFFDPTHGGVLFDDRDIRDFTLESLRRQIGLVTQETFLFNDTVFNNIAYGEPDATMEQVVAAAKEAHAHDFINTMPQGYNTVIAERGTLLSGGQRQRLAIARALLRNPPVLILDEATSALDTESERAVQGALDNAMQGRTVFAIAHRLSTIRRADQILVLEHGRIAERGRHDELLCANGNYNRLYNLQFEPEEGQP